MKYPEENPHDQIPKPADEVEEDGELKNLLARWKTPEIPGSLDRHILTAYRRNFHYQSWWRRWLTGSIRLPIPVAVAVLVLLCATSFIALRNREVEKLVPQVKVVEVAVPVEKIVTRVVYKKTREQKTGKSPAPASANIPGDLANFRPVNEIKIIVSPEGEQ
jgi:hypothetical protein